MDILQEGPELLPHCDQCGIQMLVARIFLIQEKASSEDLKITKV